MVAVTKRVIKPVKFRPQFKRSTLKKRPQTVHVVAYILVVWSNTDAKLGKPSKTQVSVFCFRR